MKLRQILTGSCNVNEQCLSVGTLYSHIFITYGSGSDLVILNHDFIRQQIIPGCNNNNLQIISVSCSRVTGKILVLYNNNICVYEPQCTYSSETKTGLNKYIWGIRSTINIENMEIRDLCWIPILSDAFILVGNSLQVWKYSTLKPQFYVENNSLPDKKWECIWRKLCPSPDHIDLVKFSSDGKFFATLSLNSIDILIWFWDQFISVSLNNIENIGSNELFDHIIIKHPSPIISFEWRSSSSFLPRNSVNNILLTCCSDNVCRIWSESYLNQYKKLSNLDDYSSINNNDTKIPDHIKNIFMNFVKEKGVSDSKEFDIALSDESLKDSDFVYTYPEFILSASINDSSDIPLFTSLNSGKNFDTKRPFIVHWLNNKEFHFNYQIKKYLDDFATNLISKSPNEILNEDVLDKLSQFNRFVLLSINKWKKSCDILFAIHPNNGSLLVWFAHNLDESGGHLCNNKSLIIDKAIHIKNSQVTVHSCLPNCIPLADAMSINSNILLYCEEIQFKLMDTNFYDINYELPVNYDIKMISKQNNGSLNMWNLSVSNEENGNSSFLNIKHLSRISGHRWQTNSAACHIHLPLLLTISNFNKISQKDNTERSELILWRIKSIGPFSKSGGITEIARINSENYLNFIKVAWFPGMIPNNLFGIDMSSPASFFIASDSQNNLSLYISIADAKNLLENEIGSMKVDRSIFNQEIGSHFEIISLTSTSEPGCILSAGFLEKVDSLIGANNENNKTVLLHVFPKDMIFNNYHYQKENNAHIFKDENESKLKYFETYFVVRIINSLHLSNTAHLEMWEIQIIDFDKNTKSKTLNDLIKLKIKCEKVFNNFLPLPKDAVIIKAVPAASHLSSASIYPSCLAPYLLTTLCSDGSIRFWKCCAILTDLKFKYEWLEWNMQLQEEYSSTIMLKENQLPLEISCAYSGRVAVAFSDNNSKVNSEPNKNINVAIYECESTGGSEWILEDCIKFPNISFQTQFKNQSISILESEIEDQSTDKIDNEYLDLKDSIQIDWVNSEDGSHLLSIALGTKIMIFTPACLEMCKYSRFTTETSALSNFTQWMKINEIILKTADSLPPIPEHISWAREGLLIVGLDNEVHVYNQWSSHTNKYDNFNNSCDEGVSETADNQKNFNDLIKKNPKTNYSLARLKDAYFNQDFKRSASKSHLKTNEIDNKFDTSDEILQNAGLFEAAQMHNPVLPQYHPKQLMEWINFGKILRVKAILSHLTSCITNDGPDFGISNKSSDNTKAQNDDLFELSQLEIKAIPPLPLYVLLEIDSEINQKSTKKITRPSISDVDEQMIDFHDTSLEDLSKDVLINTSTEASDIPWIFSSSVTELLLFTPEHAHRLFDRLTRVQLPGLSALDQIYLLGIAELMSNLNNDISDPINSLSSPINKANLKDSFGNYGEQMISTNSMDDCGLRFLLAMQHFSYMTRTLPLNQRNTLMIQGIDTSSVIWGFHSETEDELGARLDEITCHNTVWADFRRYGCGWWIRNNNTLQRMIEKVAKNTFQKSKSPMDSALFYLALGKQKLVAKLFKNCNQSGLYNFFNLDFSLEENKKRALEQAYKMRCKRKYEHAAALFLLCHSIEDTMRICLHNLKDLQLALTISRLFDMSFSRNAASVRVIIQDHVINSCDPFIRSMGYWMMDEYGKSLDSLLHQTTNSSRDFNSGNLLPAALNSTDTIVFVFYNFLKKHPIITRQKMIMNKNNLGRTSDSYITPMERRLYFRTAYTYLKMGCPDLALEVLSKLPERMHSLSNVDNLDNPKKIEKISELKNDVFDLSFDALPMDNVTFEIKWDDDDGDNNKEIDQKQENDNINGDSCLNEPLDIMCLQYKFMICLKLISEELCTLATGIESHGSFLRYHLYSWLEKEVQVLQNMCGYSTQITSSNIDKSKLHVYGILLFDEHCKFSLQEKLYLRKLWLKTNQSLILSLYSFCSLHGPNIVGLAAIRMELLILIQELQGSSCIQFDPIKYPHSSVNLPFINSSISPDNGLIITPVQQLRTFIVEIVDCLNSFNCSFSFLYHHSRQCQKGDNYDISENKIKIKLLRNQCQALSACLHQCLSNFSGIQNDEDQSNYKIRQRHRQSSTSVIFTAESDIQLRSKYLSDNNIPEAIIANSDPMKWPGYSNLFKVIGCQVKRDITNFSHLLAEALVAIYVGILVYALHLNDSNLLYRLTSVDLNKNLWAKVFGGTLRSKPDRPSGPPSGITSSSKTSPKILKNGSHQLNSSVSPNVPRNRLYSRLSPIIGSKSQSNDEKFIPPLYPILTCLLEKPTINSKSPEFIYDSDSEDTEEINSSFSIDEDDDNNEISNSECSNSKSYTWTLIRLVIFCTFHSEIKNLLKILKLDVGELSLISPNIYSILNCLAHWQKQCEINLCDFSSIPKSYIEFFHESEKSNSNEKTIKNEHVTSRLINLCKNLGNPECTPFKDNSSISLSMKRLWINLIKKSELQPLFLQHFLRAKTSSEKESKSDQKRDSSTNNHGDMIYSKSIKIIHKEHDSLFSMAINQIDKSLLVTSTSKEIIELNVNNLINPGKWFEDDYEYLQSIIREPDKTSKTSIRGSEKGMTNDFLLVSPTFGSSINYQPQNYVDSSNVILKRPIHGVQILKSHPKLPYYLAGNSNGQVGVFEWGIDTAIVKTYSPIQKGKITCLNFDSSGNKFGMGDSEGNFSLFHFSYADNSRAQYFQTHCPHKGVLDFCFLNSSSIVATCGGSTLYGITSVNHFHAVGGSISNFDNSSVNVSIWDVLLPPGRNQVRNLSDTQLSAGVTTLCYASRYELLIAGTRKGEIALIDIRQNVVQTIFQAHDLSITSIKLDPLQYYFVTSAVDGHIKVWRLFNQELIETFRSDPIKTSVFSKGDVAIKSLNIIDDNKLLSCSTDGYIKLRFMEPKLLCNNLNSDIVIL